MEIKTIGTTTIYVNSSGRFHAEINGKDVYRASLAALEKLILTDLAPLPVMVSTRAWHWNIREDELARATKHKMKGKRSSYSAYDSVYVYDKDATEKLKGLVAEHQALSERWDAILDNLTRVRPGNLEELRAEWAAKKNQLGQ